MKKLYFILENIWFSLPQKIRFLLVGGFNTVFTYIFFALLVLVLGVSYKIAIVVCYIISTNVSIFTQRYYVFKSFGNFKQEYIKAWEVYAIALLFNYTFMYIAVDILNANELISQALFTIIVIIITYIMHKYYTFKK